MIAIIDYRAGNLTSVRLALDALHVQSRITDDPARIRDAERVVFPGVGAAGAAMANLVAGRLVEAIHDVVSRRVPFLGICLGTQIALDRSDEDGGVECLGLLPGNVRPFAPVDPWDKVPQMGWNSVTLRREHPLFEGIESGSEFYFVHSYYPEPEDAACILGTTRYAGVDFASVLGAGNLVATQFHPEKSGKTGLRLLGNFCRWDGKDS